MTYCIFYLECSIGPKQCYNVMMWNLNLPGCAEGGPNWKAGGAPGLDAWPNWNGTLPLLWCCCSLLPKLNEGAGEVEFAPKLKAGTAGLSEAAPKLNALAILAADAVEELEPKDGSADTPKEGTDALPKLEAAAGTAVVPNDGGFPEERPNAGALLDAGGPPKDTPDGCDDPNGKLPRDVVEPNGEVLNDGTLLCEANAVVVVAPKLGC